MQQLMLSLLGKWKATLKEIQSLLGSLSFVTRILPIGRVFSRCWYAAISGLKNPNSHVRVTADMKEDLLVWLEFL